MGGVLYLHTLHLIFMDNDPVFIHDWWFWHGELEK